MWLGEVIWKALYRYIQSQSRHVFKEGEPIQFESTQYQPLRFVLEREGVEKATEHALLISAIQAEMLKLTGLSVDAADWNGVAQVISCMEVESLRVLLGDCQRHEVIQFDDFRVSVSRISQPKEAKQAALRVKENRKLDLGVAYECLSPSCMTEVNAILIKLDGTTSNLVSDYFCNPGFEAVSELVNQALPLLRYIASDVFNTVPPSCCSSYFKDSGVRNNLLSLPAVCFEQAIPVSAAVMVEIKRFLDLYVDKNDASYPEIFKILIEGTAHHTEKRIRLLADYQAILTHAKDKQAVLLALSQLMYLFQAPEHLAFFESLIRNSCYATALAA